MMLDKGFIWNKLRFFRTSFSNTLHLKLIENSHRSSMKLWKSFVLLTWRTLMLIGAECLLDAQSTKRSYLAPIALNRLIKCGQTYIALEMLRCIQLTIKCTIHYLFAFFISRLEFNVELLVVFFLLILNLFTILSASGNCKCGSYWKGMSKSTAWY